ncbi:MAG: hypothetical protein R2991_04415 [Thermoanaerobaculia bacterium]
MHGDRSFADDAAIVGGLATFRGRSVVVIGHQKGRSTKRRIAHQLRPAGRRGYRKALRLVKRTERFRLPIVTLGRPRRAPTRVGAEERGQAEAIARNLLEMASLTVPLVVVVTGEGSSSAPPSASATASHDGVRGLLRHLARGLAILWKDDAREEAAEAMKIAAPDLLDLGVVDGVVDEPPPGAAHRSRGGRAAPGRQSRGPGGAGGAVGEELVRQRYERFRSLVSTSAADASPGPASCGLWLEAPPSAADGLRDRRRP